MNQRSVLKGVVHGKTIQLEHEPGLPDGQSVTVLLEPESQPTSPADACALESLRRAAGAWASDSEELDRYLEWNRRQRKNSRRELPE